MSTPNRDELDKALKIYLKAMYDFVSKHVDVDIGEIEEKDIAHHIRTKWEYTFKDQFKVYDRYGKFDYYYDARTVASLIVEGRNRVLHKRLGELDPRFTQAQLFFIAEILGKINAQDPQREVETIRDKLVDDAEKESNKKLSNQILDNAIKLDEKRKELEKLSNQFADTELQVDEKEKQRKKLNRQLKDAKGRTDKLKTELARVRKHLEKSEAAQADYKKRLETAQKKLKETEEHLAQVQTENKQEVEVIRDELLDPAADRRLSNTIAHILEHERHLSTANEASTKQHETNPVNTVINPKPIEPEATVGEERTIDGVRNLVPQERKAHYESKYKKRCDAFYKAIAETQNLIQAKGWILDVEFTKIYCGFKNKKRLVFGVRITFSPPRFFAKITEEEASSLSKQYECRTVSYNSELQTAFYTIPEDLNELLPVLEFAYKKHSGS